MLALLELAHFAQGPQRWIYKAGSMKHDLRLSPCPETEVERMIESREWWIFLGNQRLIDELERTARKRFDCPSFPFYFGEVPEPFKRFINADMCTVTFAQKSALSLAQLADALTRAGAPASKIPPSQEQDILILFTPKDWKA